jgi:thioredoxin-like negative regulator of GroEL
MDDADRERLLLEKRRQRLAQVGADGGGVSATDATRVKALVEQAKSAFSAGKMHDALRGFRDAWDLAKTPEIAANLAIVEASLGQHRNAAEHFQFALSHLSPSATVDQRQAVAAGLDTESGKW